MLRFNGAFGRRAPGFSLLEMMVVLILIALASGLVVTRVGAGKDVADTRRALQEMTSALANARRSAIRSGRPRLVELSQDGVTTFRTTEMPNLQEQSSAKSILVRFFPDGSSTGGRIILRAPVSATLTIGRFVGGVTVEPSDE
ncbi:MAG: Tfp pilus assembly protein FimT/FimU [Paracoccaceae bacterium]